MADEKFDVIVVGAGPAGLAAAYKLVQAGLEVVVIERGDNVGVKNLSGGILYSHALAELIPEFWDEAPVERCMTNQVLMLMAKDASTSVKFTSDKFGNPPNNNYSVLRSHFDRWLGEKVEQAGAMMITGIRVDGLARHNGRIVGVIADKDTINADVVIAADGANSFLAKKSGLRGPINNEHLAVGVKEVIGLRREVLEARFNLTGDEGTAYAIVGYATRGVGGGAFLYTNKESLSVGIVLRLDDLLRAKVRPPEVMGDFLEHPAIKPLVAGGTLLEYGAHLVPEGGLHMMPKLFTDGMLVVGDAAGFTLNTGFVVRGMDLAIGSGIAAAEAILGAKKAGDFSAKSLSVYERILKDSFVMWDLERYSKAPAFMETNRLYNAYPELAARVMFEMYDHKGQSHDNLIKVMMKAMKDCNVSIMDLGFDALKGIRSL